MINAIHRFVFFFFPLTALHSLPSLYNNRCNPIEQETEKKVKQNRVCASASFSIRLEFSFYYNSLFSGLPYALTQLNILHAKINIKKKEPPTNVNSLTFSSLLHTWRFFFHSFFKLRALCYTSQFILIIFFFSRAPPRNKQRKEK